MRCSDLSLSLQGPHDKQSGIKLMLDHVDHLHHANTAGFMIACASATLEIGLEVHEGGSAWWGQKEKEEKRK